MNELEYSLFNTVTLELMLELEKIAKILLCGLTTDGAHHKQYYLEKALKALITDKAFNEAKKEFDWEPGIED